MRRLLLLTMLVAGCAVQQQPHVSGSCGTEQGGSISGVVTHSETGERLADALVVLQSTSLQGTRETSTNDDGLYAFRDLPPGTYTIQVLRGRADVAKVTTLPRDAKFRANFKLDPDGDGIVCRFPVRQRPDLGASLFSVTNADEARLLGMPRTIYR